MRSCKRVVSLLFVFIALFCFIPVSAFATDGTETLKLNTWYDMKGYSSNQVYKIKISTDTVLIANWKNNTETDNYASINVYADKECQKTVGNNLMGLKAKVSGSSGIVLYSGTYYIKMIDFNVEKKVKVKFQKKQVKSINKPNYCLATAISLKAKKKAVFAQTIQNNYQRWYRIKLTKNQVISIYGNFKYMNSCVLYDSNFNTIRYTEGNDGIVTDGIQTKGTYYLVMYDNISGLLKAGRYYSVFWK